MMQKTVFNIAKMDCPSEEQMIRMKLAGCRSIHALDFDIPGRRLTVYHEGGHEAVFKQLDSLKFDTTLISSEAVDTIEQGAAAQEQGEAERALLWQVLAINLFFFFLEAVSGVLAGSMGLLADSLDMLADSAVYALALLAVGGTVQRKKKTAFSAGVFQLVLALWGFAEVVQRFIGWERVPDFKTMIAVSLLALAGNALCLYLLQKSKSREAHMQASMIFTSNDIIVNLGVIAAGAFTLWTHSKYPDLIVGTIVFVLVASGAWKILKLAR